MTSPPERPYTDNSLYRSVSILSHFYYLHTSVMTSKEEIERLIDENRPDLLDRIVPDDRFLACLVKNEVIRDDQCLDLKVSLHR